MLRCIVSRRSVMWLLDLIFGKKTTEAPIKAVQLTKKELIAQVRSTIREYASDAVSLKATLAELRKAGPKTGAERDSLKKSWDCNERVHLRALLLLYGYLRGVAYQTLERHTAKPVPYHTLKY